MLAKLSLLTYEAQRRAYEDKRSRELPALTLPALPALTLPVVTLDGHIFAVYACWLEIDPRLYYGTSMCAKLVGKQVGRFTISTLPGALKAQKVHQQWLV